MHITRIGVIGLGRMGLPMAASLARGGFTVTGFDPLQSTRAPAQAAGVRWEPAPDPSVGECQVVISMLASSEVTLEVARVAVPLLPAGSTWIDMGSNGPELSGHLAGLTSAAGVDLLEAPVGGGPLQAQRAELQLFVGGGADTLEAMLPVLRALADPARIHHIGPAGHGYLAKLLVNLLWFSQAVATTEALLLAGRSELDLGRLHEAMRHSAVAGRFVESDLTSLLAGNYLPTFGLADCVVELDALERLAVDAGSPFELSAVVARTYREALAEFGPVDGELLGPALLERRAQLVLHEQGRPPGRSPGVRRG